MIHNYSHSFSISLFWEINTLNTAIYWRRFFFLRHGRKRLNLTVTLKKTAKSEAQHFGNMTKIFWEKIK